MNLYGYLDEDYLHIHLTYSQTLQIIPAMVKEHNIVITDFSGGDDKAAALVLMGQQHRDGLSFVSTFGNRSSQVCFRNMQTWIPEMNRHLRHPYDPSPNIYYGADRPIKSRKRYTIKPGDIETFIHEDMGHDRPDTPHFRKNDRSAQLYRMVDSQPSDVRILSLGATSELPHALQKIRSKIQSLVIMGGVLSIQGNTAPHQEANLRHDPNATVATLAQAREQNIPIVLLPLDTSEQEGVQFTADRLKFLNSKIKSAFALNTLRSVAGRAATYGAFYLNRTHHQDRFPYHEVPYTGVPLHDLTAAVAQYDYHNGQSIFTYTKSSIHHDALGQIGIARGYMEPHTPVTIVGPLKSYDEHWKTVVEHLQSYR